MDITIVNRESTGLLSLPREIRLHIYSCLFEDARLVIDMNLTNNHSRKPYRESGFCTNLLLTCRVIRAEAAIILERSRITLSAYFGEQSFSEAVRQRTICREIPAEWRERVRALETPEPILSSTPADLFERLEEIYLSQRAYHFPDDQTPTDQDLQHKIFLAMLGPDGKICNLGGRWPPDLCHDMTVWFLDTEKRYTEGWEMQIDLWNRAVLSAQKARFVRKAAEGDEDEPARLSTIVESNSKGSRYLSTDNWTIQRLDEWTITPGTDGESRKERADSIASVAQSLD